MFAGRWPQQKHPFRSSFRLPPLQFSGCVSWFPPEAFRALPWRCSGSLPLARPKRISTSYWKSCRFALAIAARKSRLYSQRRKPPRRTVMSRTEFPKIDPQVDGGASEPRGGFSPFLAALREQLGLQLYPGQGRGEFLAIDRVDKPSENLTLPAESRQVGIATESRLKCAAPALVGRTPWSAADAPVGLFGDREF